MHWLRSHPFALLFAGAGMLLLVIIIAIQGKTAPSSSLQIGVIASSGHTALEDPGISQPYTTSPPTETQQPGATPGEKAPAASPAISATPSKKPTSQTSPQPQTTVSASTETSVPTLTTTTGPAKPGPDTSIGDSIIQQVYALIPSASSLPVNTPVSRTPSQQALYIYGNQAGLVVLSFENAHADMADVLKTWTENRGSASATTNAKLIATDMSAVGDQLLALPNVPSSAVAANQNLAKGYKTAAQQLLTVLGGGSESGLVDSMKTYNASADDFTRSYIALIDLFSQNGVTFSPSDTGSAFAFSAPSL